MTPKKKEKERAAVTVDLRTAKQARRIRKFYMSQRYGSMWKYWVKKNAPNNYSVVSTYWAERVRGDRSRLKNKNFTWSQNGKVG